jgi:hypothetical protein
MRTERGSRAYPPQNPISRNAHQAGRGADLPSLGSIGLQTPTIKQGKLKMSTWHKAGAYRPHNMMIELASARQHHSYVCGSGLCLFERIINNADGGWRFECWPNSTQRGRCFLGAFRLCKSACRREEGGEGGGVQQTQYTLGHVILSRQPHC